jgi:hypothetical protein
VLVSLAVVFALVAVPAYAATRSPAPVEGLVAMTSSSCTFDHHSDPGRTHVASPSYSVDPPSGGDHLPVAALPGAYWQDAPPVGQLVHSLEHGYVVLWVGSGVDEAGRAAIETVRARFARDLIVVPHVGAQPAVAATAWGTRLLCGTVEPAALRAFITEFRDKGPERVPHG